VRPIDGRFGRIFLNQFVHAEVLAVPKNMKLLAIPLFELYDNAARYVTVAVERIRLCAYFDYVLTVVS